MNLTLGPGTLAGAEKSHRPPRCPLIPSKLSSRVTTRKAFASVRGQRALRGSAKV